MPFLPYSSEQVMDRLRFDNPWWVTRQTGIFYKEMQPRQYFELFRPLVMETSIRRALVLMGPRRVGKTVMMHHSIQQLLDDGQDPLKIAFISVETPIYNGMGLEALFGMCRKVTHQDSTAGWYIFFDEVQYLKDWEIHVKSLVDSYPNCKFIVSGSAAAALKYKSQESGAGRFTDFMLPPLTFSEYIALKKLDGLLHVAGKSVDGSLPTLFTTHHIQELNRHFLDYINYGGYPEVIFSPIMQQDPGRYIRNDIIDKVLLRDLPMLYGIRDVQELNALFTSIAYNSAGEVSLDDLSKQSGVQKITIKKYLEYLEAAFLIKVVHKISNKPKHFQRATQFKIYLTNPSLRTALFTPILQTDPFIGNMIETAVIGQWLHQDRFTPYYARWQKGEVDLIRLDERVFQPLWALEIKWSNAFFEKPGDLKPLLQFMDDNQMKQAVVTTLDKEMIKEVEGRALQFIPASLYAYAVSQQVFTQRTGIHF
jgi:uncharacterized protein